jgi:predicted GNAT family acetyltransferase
VPLTLVDTLRRRGPHAYGPGDPLFGVWRAAEGEVGGFLLQTPPFPMLFSAIPAEAVPAAVEALAGRPLSGVNMLAGVVDEFVARWHATAAGVKMRTRLYVLDTLVPPRVAGGRARVATARDRDLLLEWSAAFQEEIGERPAGDPEAFVDERIGYGGIVLWEVRGVPVAVATRSPIEAGMSRVQMVYTPKEHRGRGYGGAATTDATRNAIAHGADSVVLYTDLANPTSNALYQRLGFRPVEDRVVVEFS